MLKRFLIGFAALATAGAIVGVASQGNLILPTTGTVTGVEFSSLVTQANLANASCHSGGASPSNATGGAAVAGQCWYDTSTTPITLKMFDGTQWVTLGRVDAAAHLWIPTSAGGAANVASAGSMDLCATPQTYITITGGGTINSFGSGTCQVGQFKVIRFGSATTLTYNASVMVLPNSASVTTQPNEIGVAIRATAGGRWDVMLPRTPGEAGAPPATGIEVPIAGMIPYAGFDLPAGGDFEWCAGQSVSQATYPDYTAAVSKTYTGISRSGTTLTGFPNTHQLRAQVESPTSPIPAILGMQIVGTGIATGARIASKTGTEIVMTAAATTGGTGSVTIFAHGGTANNVNLPDVRGRVFAGRDDMNNAAASMLTAGGPNFCRGDGLGALCGYQEGKLTVGMLPDFNKTVNFGANATWSGSGAVASGSTILSSPAVMEPGAAASMNHTHSMSTNITLPNETSASDPGRYSTNYSLVDVEWADDQSIPISGTTGSANLAHRHNTNISGTSVNVTGSVGGSQLLTFGSDGDHTKLQPTFVANCIVRVK